MQLRQVAKEWLEAGADVISTATYQASTKQIQAEFGVSPAEAERVMILSRELVDEERRTFWDSLASQQKQARRYPAIAVSCGPYIATLPTGNEYTGLYPSTSSYEIHSFHVERLQTLRKLFEKGFSSQRNVLCFETIGNKTEASLIVRIMGTSAFCHIPYWISFQCRDAERIADGNPLSLVVKMILHHCEKPNLVAIGINCVDVTNIMPLLKIIRTAVAVHMDAIRGNGWRIDTVCYPNRQAFSSTEMCWKDKERLDSIQWARLVSSTQSKLVGGCCTVGPDFIRALHNERLNMGNN